MKTMKNNIASLSLNIQLIATETAVIIYNAVFGTQSSPQLVEAECKCIKHFFYHWFISD